MKNIQNDAIIKLASGILKDQKLFLVDFQFIQGPVTIFRHKMLKIFSDLAHF